jgi:hypothetical protein
MTRARDLANVFSHSNALASDAEMSAMLLNYKQEIAVAVSSNITALAGRRYAVDTTAARNITLPASPAVGDEVQVMDATGTAATNNITILRNSNKITGLLDDAIIDTNGGMLKFIYTGSTYGWGIN